MNIHTNKKGPLLTSPIGGGKEGAFGFSNSE